jgi:lipopolysaccharide/colanic/teichoic acid biosynthesis glycosyltransferase
MSTTHNRSGLLGKAPADFVICLASFVLLLSLFLAWSGIPDRLWSFRQLLGFLAVVMTSWFSLFSLGPHEPIRMNRWLEQVLYSIGLGLVSQWALAYILGIKPIPLVVLVGGCLLSTGIALRARRALHGAGTECGAFLIGFDPAAEAMSSLPEYPVRGVLDSKSNHLPAGVIRFETANELAESVAVAQPGRIVIGDRDWQSRISPRALLSLGYSGNSILDIGELYEHTFCRIGWWRMRPLEAVFATAETISPAAVAIQSVYTNLIGLTLLILFSPVLVTIAIASKVLLGGAVLERTECPGFQRTPFHLLRFRGREPNGGWLGTFLSRTHLAGLPQLINVVRGEMAVFGPPPVRTEFAERLGLLIPAYSYRFLTKPGILGWSQLFLRDPGRPINESLRLEYDLYYVNNASVPLDLEILLRSLGRLFSRGGLDPARNSRDTLWGL